jgi:deoxyribodipyrimidine photo-lyase
VGIRECTRQALAAGADGQKWLSELIWREFYQHILFHFPHVVSETFQPHYRDLMWPGEEAHWEAWVTGQTGYPIVDAAMRCFNATGWMHNRLRMIVASFLTKDLLIDYRRGEAYFARYLLDFDLASNNGGWQWAASTGCDAQPYFRIFNPVLQSLKFDPDGRFIREWVPELAGLEGRTLHAPSEASMMERISAGAEAYPDPVVDHHVQKERAVALLTRGAQPGGDSD